jgi:hypothetical protein
MRFFKFQLDYSIKFGPYLISELPPMRDLGSQYFLNRHTFVCESLFPGIKLN